MIETTYSSQPSILSCITAKLAHISNRMLILWCYLIWYLIIVIHCFDNSQSIWVTALGISGLVGIALNLSTGGFTRERIKTKTWEVFRLFLVPFCVSSFSALVKGKGFFLVIAPDPLLNIKAVAACMAFTLLVFLSRCWTNINRSRK